MQQLYGEYECSVDEKGRLKLPSALLRNVGGNPPYKFFVNRGFEKCLMLYPEKVWEKIVEKVNNLNSFVTEERNFIRYFFRGLRDVATDSAERILLPKPLLEFAGIQKEVVLFGYMDRVEIWDKAAYYAWADVEPDNFALMSDRLLGNKSESGNQNVL
ncbi:MAG: division/cell wall cluster transcriptional repressor MraZ [Saprospiraceae bacterium]|nr:division/cell wall cluster transcriptional repressor MraZ [Saprospiraceae bacterium]